ncbi:MAG: hypothetical protein RIM23_01810 [Coleofasciculus sp. G3-WIS-01]
MYYTKAKALSRSGLSANPLKNRTEVTLAIAKRFFGWGNFSKKERIAQSKSNRK